MARLTADQITLDWLKSVDVRGFRASLSGLTMADPVVQAVNALLQTPEGKRIATEMANDPDYVPVAMRKPSAEEQEQIDADLALADQQAQEAAATQAVEAEQQNIQLQAYQEAQAAKRAAEDVLAAQYGISIVRDAYGNVDKVVQDYQVTDEDGRPLGRQTHFESNSLVEAIAKVQNAHVNAVRYAERAKSNKLKQSAATLAANEKSEAARSASERSARLAEEAVNAKDAGKMREAVQASVAAEQEAEKAAAAAREQGKVVAEIWMADHAEDFLPCQASSQIMGAYMQANGLGMTYDNLETTFQAVKSQLPVPPRITTDAASVTLPTNTATVTTAAPAVVATAAQPSIPAAAVPAKQVAPVTALPAAPPVTPTSAATAPTTTPVTANQPQVTRKSAINGGLQPGALSAQRPVVVEVSPEQIRSELLREISKMPNSVYRKKIATDAKFIERHKAAGIPVIGK